MSDNMMMMQAANILVINFEATRNLNIFKSSRFQKKFVFVFSKKNYFYG